jgi:hypothetical protein
VLPAAGKYLDTELILEQADLFADTRLGREKALGSCGDIKVVVGHFPDVAQLLKLH